MQQRQGDLLFVNVSTSNFEQGKKKSKPYKTNILAYGEVTGHCHKITTPIDDAKMFVTEDGDILISSDKDVVIGHDEHGSITLPPGEYHMTRQREYDWATEETNKVKD